MDSARLLDRPQGVPPKEQRILAPSLVAVNPCNMGSAACECSLQITDPINLAVYYVPCTPQMVEQIRADLAHYDPTLVQLNAQEAQPE